MFFDGACGPAFQLKIHIGGDNANSCEVREQLASYVLPWVGISWNDCFRAISIGPLGSGSALLTARVTKFKLDPVVIGVTTVLTR